MNPKVALEIIWWVVTALITAGVLFPIVTTVDGYPFLWVNSIFIIVFVTFTRYIFLLKYTFLAYSQYGKAAFILTSLITIFLLGQEVNLFQTFVDENGWEAVVGEGAYTYRQTLVDYIHTEMLFFGVGSILSAVVLVFRLLISVWRYHNRGTV